MADSLSGLPGLKHAVQLFSQQGGVLTGGLFEG